MLGVVMFFFKKSFPCFLLKAANRVQVLLSCSYIKYHSEGRIRHLATVAPRVRSSTIALSLPRSSVGGNVFTVTSKRRQLFPTRCVAARRHCCSTSYATPPPPGLSPAVPGTAISCPRIGHGAALSCDPMPGCLTGPPPCWSRTRCLTTGPSHCCLAGPTSRWSSSPAGTACPAPAAPPSSRSCSPAGAAVGRHGQ
jgi:hypothetical protein